MRKLGVYFILSVLRVPNTKSIMKKIININALGSTTYHYEKRKFRTLIATIALSILFWVFLTLQAQSQVFPEVEPNVPYSEVAKLNASPHASEIAYGDLPDQNILFWPAVGTKKNNTVIFIHGGCWLAQFDIKHSLAFTSGLASKGFDVFSIEYRRSGNGGEWPVALNDIQLALAAIHQALAPGNNVYNEPVSLVGHSAGGHLATLVALDIRPEHFNKVHLFGLAPIIDLVAYAQGENSCQTATPAFMGGTVNEQAEAYQAANPLEYKELIDKSPSSNLALKSAIMMVGNRDIIVPQSMAQHPSAEFALIDQAGHFDWIHPGSDAFKQLVAKLSVVGTEN